MSRPQTTEEVVRWWYADQMAQKAGASDPEAEAYHEGFIDALRLVAKSEGLDLSHA